jgi:hypothetical protein
MRAREPTRSDDLSGARARSLFGSGAQPSVSLWLGESEHAHVCVTIYSTSVAVNFEWLRPYRSLETLEALAAQLRKVDGAASYLEEV